MNKEFDDAMAALDGIAKAKDGKNDGIDDLTKSLEKEFEGKDGINKSQGDGQDDNGNAGPGDGLGKAVDIEEFINAELVKASETYSAMEEAIVKSHEEIRGEIDSIKKSLAALINLGIKQAHFIAEMSKSQGDDREAMAKSRETIDTLVKSISELDLGARPGNFNKAVLGQGNSDDGEQPVQKSRSEIQDALMKAVDEGRVAAMYLTQFGTYQGDVRRLPEFVRKEIGVE